MKNMKVPDWESHLVLRAQAGDRVGFEFLADQHRPAMMRLACRLLRNFEDASDAVQEALLKAFKGFRDFEVGRPVRPWLLRIVANCCVDQVRGRRLIGENLEWHENTLSDESGQTDEAAEASVQCDQVRAAVDRLPVKYRDIIMMRHFRHMDVCEIALALNKPEGTIKSWLFRARALLRKDLSVAIG